MKEAQVARHVLDLKFQNLEQKQLQDRRLQLLGAGGDNSISSLLSKALVIIDCSLCPELYKISDKYRNLYFFSSQEQKPSVVEEATKDPSKEVVVIKADKSRSIGINEATKLNSKRALPQQTTGSHAQKHKKAVPKPKQNLTSKPKSAEKPANRAWNYAATKYQKTAKTELPKTKAKKETAVKEISCVPAIPRKDSSPLQNVSNYADLIRVMTYRYLIKGPTRHTEICSDEIPDPKAASPSSSTRLSDPKAESTTVPEFCVAVPLAARPHVENRLLATAVPLTDRPRLVPTLRFDDTSYADAYAIRTPKTVSEEIASQRISEHVSEKPRLKFDEKPDELVESNFEYSSDEVSSSKTTVVMGERGNSSSGQEVKENEEEEEQEVVLKEIQIIHEEDPVSIPGYCYEPKRYVEFLYVLWIIMIIMTIPSPCPRLTLPVKGRDAFQIPNRVTLKLKMMWQLWIGSMTNIEEKFLPSW